MVRQELTGLCLSSPMLTADAACTVASTQGQDRQRCFLGEAHSFLQMLLGGEGDSSAATTFVVSHLVAAVSNGEMCLGTSAA